MENYELKVLADLVSFKTDCVTKEEYLECAEYIEGKGEELGYETEILDAGNLASDGKPRPNVLIRKDVGAEKTVFMATHYDVVPAGSGWTKPPYILTVEGKKAYGRGTADTKGTISASLGALKILRKKKLRYNIIFTATCDEEENPEFGMKYVAEKLKGEIDYVVILDSSPEYISIGASGILHGEITVEGKGGHAGYPFLAENPIKKAAELIIDLKRYEDELSKRESIIPAPEFTRRSSLWPRFTVTMINAGIKENVIPNQCKIRFDRRLVPEEEIEKGKRDVLKAIQARSKKLKIKVNVKFTYSCPGYYTDPSHPLVKEFKRSIEKTLAKPCKIAGELGANDGHILAEMGKPVISYGLIRRDTNFHTKNEFVHLEDLLNLRKILTNFLVL